MEKNKTVSLLKEIKQRLTDGEEIDKIDLLIKEFEAIPEGGTASKDVQISKSKIRKALEVICNFFVRLGQHMAIDEILNVLDNSPLDPP